MIHRGRLRRLHREESDTPEAPVEPTFKDPYQSQLNLKATDVRLARAILAKFKLPTEIVLSILDFADYYPIFTAHLAKNVVTEASDGANNENCSLYLATKPLLLSNSVASKFVLKWVKFKIKSRDQGWGGDTGTQGTYNGAYSWFEATIIRNKSGTTDTDFLRPLRDQNFNKSAPASFTQTLQANGFEFVTDSHSNVTWLVQRNMVASREMRDHEILWRNGEVLEDEGTGAGSGDKFVEKLQKGDMIGLWARAQYPGWQNCVQEAVIEVGYDVQDVEDK